MNDMYDRVKEYIGKNHMLEGIERVVVGLSGGADSVCLLFMLQRYLHENSTAGLLAVHVNHGIRGADARYDAAYCKELCKRLGIQYKEYFFDVPRLAKERGCGEEEMGRRLRYAVFRENAGSDGRGVIAVAHHENDQAETVLFHIARGAYISGGRGMEPVSGDIIRPLLCVSRKEIESWLSRNNIAYRTDKTNFDDGYARNALRLKVLPYLEEHVNSGAVANICRYAESMAQLNDYVNKQTDIAYEKYVDMTAQHDILVKNELLEEHPVILRAVIYRVLKGLCGARDLEDKHVASGIGLFSKQCGRSISFPENVRAVRGYEGIFFESMSNNSSKNKASASGYTLESRILDCDSEEIYGEEGFAKLVNGIIDKNLMNDNCTKYFDYGKIKEYIAGCKDGAQLAVRHRAEGDYMVIGYAGAERREMKKKLKEIFIDAKVPAAERDLVWLCTIGSRVLWAAGVRRCAEFLVDADTTELFRLELVKRQE